MEDVPETVETLTPKMMGSSEDMECTPEPSEDRKSIPEVSAEGRLEVSGSSLPFKPNCHIQFTHGFYLFQSILEVLTLVSIDIHKPT